MNNDVGELKLTIDRARAYARQICEGRALLAGILGGAFDAIGVELEFPEPDIMHVYTCMLDHRMGEPAVYRLSFGRPLKWVGVSHPWGLKPTDIIVEEETPCKVDVS